MSAPQRFERRDPWPLIPFDTDEFKAVPGVGEVLGWIVLGGAFLALCVGFLGIA